MVSAPKTAEAVMALPIGSMLRVKEVVVDGRRMSRPVIEPARCRTMAPDDIAFVVDEDGSAWRPEQRNDGSWYRTRYHL